MPKTTKPYGVAGFLERPPKQSAAPKSSAPKPKIYGDINTFYQALAHAKHSQYGGMIGKFLGRDPNNLQALTTKIAPKYQWGSHTPITTLDYAKHPDRVMQQEWLGSRGGKAEYDPSKLVAESGLNINLSSPHKALLSIQKKALGRPAKELHDHINTIMKKYSIDHDSAFRMLDYEIQQKGNLHAKDAKALWQKYTTPKDMNPDQFARYIVDSIGMPGEQEKLHHYADLAKQLERYDSLKGKARTAAFPGGRPDTAGLKSAIGLPTGTTATPASIRYYLALTAKNAQSDALQTLIDGIRRYQADEKKYSPDAGDKRTVAGLLYRLQHPNTLTNTAASNAVSRIING